MTVAIQIPIISTSPPATVPVQQNAKPEKSGNFEQILQQKTKVSSSHEDGPVQNDQVVKNQHEDPVQTESKPEVKPVKGEKRSDNAENVKSTSDQKDQKTEESSSQPQPTTDAQPAVSAVFVPVEQVSPVVQTQSTEGDSKVDDQSVTAVAKAVSETKGKASSVPFVEVSANVDNTTETTAERTSKSDNTEQNQGKGKTAKAGSDFADAFNTAKSDTQPNKTSTVQRSVNEEVQPAKVSTTVPTKSEQVSFKDQSLNSSKPGTAETPSPELTVQVKASSDDTSGSNAKVEDKDNLTESMADVKPFSQGNVEKTASKVGKIDGAIQANNDQKSPVAQTKVPQQSVEASSDSQTKFVKFDTAPERKVEQEAPPEPSGSTAPTISPGVVNERMRMDPFTGKINEPARLAEAQTSDILRQISRQVAGTSGTGSQSIRIQLHPEDLGQIDLRISTSPVGTHVTLIADQSSTGKLLETHIAQLKQTLTDAGVQLANVHVGQQFAQQSFHEMHYGQNAARHQASYNPVRDNGVEEAEAIRSRSSSSLVDYLI